jgi:hypothetical protein
MHVTRFDGHLIYVAPCGLVSWYQSFRGTLLGTTNKMQRFTIFFVIVNALHVSGGETA